MTPGRAPPGVRREAVWGRSGEGCGRTWRRKERRKGKEGAAVPPRGAHGRERGPADGATPRWSCRYWEKKKIKQIYRQKREREKEKEREALVTAHANG